MYPVRLCLGTLTISKSGGRGCAGVSAGEDGPRWRWSTLEGKVNSTGSAPTLLTAWPGTAFLVVKRAKETARHLHLHLHGGRQAPAAAKFEVKDVKGGIAGPWTG